MKRYVKTERNAEMVRLYTEEHMTLEAIGDLFGVTRQRVEQIVRRAGVGRDVSVANAAIRSEEKLVDSVCERCGRVTRRLPAHARRTRFCSNLCWGESKAYGSEFLLDALRRLALLLGQTPGTLDLVSPWPSHSCYYRQFGSLSRAAVLAGLFPSLSGAPGHGVIPLPDGFREEWAHLTESAA